MRSKTYSPRILVAFALLLTPFAVSQAASNVDYVDQPWGFNVGGGYSPVVGGLNGTLSDGWNFDIGVGYKLTEKFAVNLEYMNNHLGVENGVLSNYSSLMGGVATDGSANIWSVTVNPTWNFELGDVVGGYLIGGGGYYHARAEITTPGLAYMPPYCDYYWGCWPGGVVPADRIIGERKDDTGGVNAGVGFTFDIWSSTQFYVEARYHFIMMHGPDLQILPFTAGFRF